MCWYVFCCVTMAWANHTIYQYSWESSGREVLTVLWGLVSCEWSHRDTDGMWVPLWLKKMEGSPDAAANGCNGWMMSVFVWLQGDETILEALRELIGNFVSLTWCGMLFLITLCSSLWLAITKGLPTSIWVMDFLSLKEVAVQCIPLYRFLTLVSDQAFTPTLG